MIDDQLKNYVPDALKDDLRELVRCHYSENPSYNWLGEDIYDELEELIDDEMNLCKARPLS